MNSFLSTYFPVVKDASGRESTVLRVHHAIYFVLLTILVAAQVVSKFMMSGMQILLVVNWLLEGAYLLFSHRRGTTHSTIRNESRWLLYAFLVMMGVHLLWLLRSNNMEYAMSDIFGKMPLLAIPVVLLTSRPLNLKQLVWLLFAFVIAIFVTTIIGVVRIMTIPDLPYRDTVPFISHIRFSLNICGAIVLLVWFVAKTMHSSKTKAIVSVLMMVWFLVFLVILRSYTAFIVLFVTAWIMLLIYWRRMGVHRRWALASLSVLTVALALTTFVYARSYYGGDFSKTQYGLVENGNLLNDNVSQSELEQQWHTRSSMDIYDTTPNGYTVYPTLVRYLNASGMTKDSAGLAQLTGDDIRSVEKGIANPVYVKGSNIKKMYFVLLFEYENYRVNGSIRNSSMLERFELWRGAWRVFCANLFLGVGTGDGVDELHSRLQADNSQISDTVKHAHNQYLSFLVSFGLVGFLLIAIAFVYAFRRLGLRSIPAMMAIVIILLLSFVSEDTLETLAGCVLCTVIPCILARMEK